LTILLPMKPAMRPRTSQAMIVIAQSLQTRTADFAPSDKRFGEANEAGAGFVAGR
jgi:hypothetical protein